MGEQLLWTDFIYAHAHYAPWILFGALCLAGLNIPVSEDALIFVAALLASKNPESLPSLFFAIYAGAYISDLISYALGRILGPQLWKIRFFSKMLSRERMDKVKGFYERYGMATLVVGRFIPFGVRNALFITAGLSRMNFLKFAFCDLIAATLTSVLFFTLYYNFGEDVIDTLKKGPIVLLAIVIVSIIFFTFKARQKKI